MPLAQNLRIAFATPEYVTEKPFDCGLATYIHRVGKALVDLGHEVHVITLSQAESEFEHDGVRVHRVKVARIWLQLSRLTRYRLADSLYLLGLSAGVYRKLKELNRRHRFDLIQFPYCPYCGLVSMFFLRVPHVIRASWYEAAWNDLTNTTPRLDRRIIGALERLQLRFSPHVCTPSQSLRKTLTERRGLSDVRVIPSPVYVETADWDYAKYEELLRGKKYLLFFGRFELRKGFQVLCQALPRFLERETGACAVFVGRDLASSLAPSMAEYARSLLSAYGDRVLIIDRLSHALLYPIIEQAQLVVLPSLMDNLPNACLEAMALGKVVLGTRGASFEEMISDGENGFLVTPDSPDELAEKILAAWTNPRLDAIGRAAREKARDYAPEHTVKTLLAYYQEVLNENGESPGGVGTDLSGVLVNGAVDEHTGRVRTVRNWWSRGGSNP